MTKEDYKNELLVSLRQKKGVTQESLAESIDVTRFTIIRAEKGEAASWKLLQSFATYYDIPISELLRASESAQIAA